MLQKIKSKSTLGFSIVGTVLIFLFATPFITYDGYQYLSSAKAIYDNTMALNYFWVREPGYPLFISQFLRFENLTILFLFQTLLYFISSIRLIKIFAQSQKIVGKQLVYLYMVFGILTIWIGGYNFGILQQSLMISTFNLILSEALIINEKLKNNETFEFTNQLNLLILGTWSALLADVIRNIFIVIVAYLFIIFWSRRKLYSTTLFKRRLSFTFLNIIVIVLLSLFWNDFKGKNSTLPANNWNSDASTSVNLKSYVKSIFIYPRNAIDTYATSLGSLTNLTENKGWIGITIQAPDRVDQYQNELFGFGPLSDRTFRECLSTSEQEIISVTDNYGQEYLSKTLCKFTFLYIPYFVNEMIYISWLMILLFYFRSLLNWRNDNVKWVKWIPFIYLSQYAFIGGAIDRYGVPVYIAIGMLSTSEILKSLTRLKSKLSDK